MYLQDAELGDDARNRLSRKNRRDREAHYIPILRVIGESRFKRRLEVFSDSSPDFEARVLEKLLGAGDWTGEGSFPARNSRLLSLTKHRGAMRCWEGGDSHHGDC
jgi:hypothetical protein